MHTKTHEEYNLEKLAHARELALQNKFFRKSRAIIVKGNKLLLLRNTKNHTLQLPGGGIDENENAKKAAERESREETNAIVKASHYLGKYYYTAKLEYNGETFASKRVSFIYVCDFIRFVDSKPLGIEGEFADKVELCEVPFSHINKISIPPRLRQKALEYLTQRYKK